MVVLDDAMMQIRFSEVCSSGNLNCFDLDFSSEGCTVLYDPTEHLSASILATLVGLQAPEAGELYLDGVEYNDFFLQHRLISTFAFVFDEGIMLANLTIRENLLLPWKLRFPGESLTTFDTDLGRLLRMLDIECDVNLRPALVSPAMRKFLGFIRGVMLKPRILLIDDPFYLFNKIERTKIFNFLQEIKAEQDMLIASADDEFLGDIATKVIDFNSQRIEPR